MNLDAREAPILPQALRQMEAADLIRREFELPLAYAFKHQLVQETAYASLTRHERRRLHAHVAYALETEARASSGAERLTELAPLLGEHFREAGEPVRALEYFQRAAYAADARFETQEALYFYAQALEAARETAAPAQGALLIARGIVHERTGDFDAATADLQDALALAQASHDTRLEWEAHLQLGFAYSARDYARVGGHFERALELAHALGEPALIAHSLNRVGNWHLNREAPERAMEMHREALAIFERLQQPRGIAETHDLLGMTNLMLGDLVQGHGHYRSALAQFNALGDRQAIINELISMYLQGVSYQADTHVIPPDDTLATHDVEALLRELDELGWRAGACYAYWLLGERAATLGNYGVGLELVERGIRLATEINHRQWLCAGRMVRGLILTDMYAYGEAELELARALDIAEEVGSEHWRRSVKGYLALNHIRQGRLVEAHAVLDTALPAQSRARSLGQRQVIAARVELALAEGDLDGASAELERLLADTANLTPEVVVPRLTLFRARILMQQGDDDAAEPLLGAVLTAAEAQGVRTYVRRAHVELARLHQRKGAAERAAEHFAAAEQVAQELASTITDDALRAGYVEGTRGEIT